MEISPEVKATLSARTIREITRAAVIAAKTGRSYNPVRELAAADRRLEAGLALAEKEAVAALENGAFAVEGSEALYAVGERLAQPCACSSCSLPVHCSCPDHSHRGTRCKHIIAVAAVLRERARSSR